MDNKKCISLSDEGKYSQIVQKESTLGYALGFSISPSNFQYAG
jgi:hypothetical protein